MTPLRTRLLVGAIAGIVGTAAMTATMRRLRRALPADERYPLPPREITERVLPAPSSARTADRTVASHFGFGAVAGALLTGLGNGGTRRGSVLGPAIWFASYFGWVPAAGILRPASSHPWRRNALMVAAHVVWGAATAATAKELLAARSTIFAGGPPRDVPAHPEE